MKIIYENPTHGQKVTIEDIRDDADIWEMQEILERLLLGMGYQQENIDCMFGKYKDNNDI